MLRLSGLPAFVGSAAAGFSVAAILIVALAQGGGWRAPAGSAMWKASHPMDVGVNVTGIAHYGYGDFFPRTSDADVDADLAQLEGMGAGVIRVLAAYDGVSAEQSAARLDRFLTRAEQHHISVLVSFINYYGSRQSPPGVARYYTERWQGIPYLNHQFMAEDYQGEYLAFIRTVIGATRQHPNVYAWEPGNELQDSDKQAFLRFMQTTSALIKSLDPGRPVASGMIEARQAAFTPDEFYGQLPDVDMIAIHPGNGYRGSGIDVDWAVAHGRKAIVEETGFAGFDDRTARYAQEIDHWWRRGVSAFILDGFVGKGLPDNGNADNSLGFDTIWHAADYDGLAGLVRSMSTPWGRATFRTGD